MRDTSQIFDSPEAIFINETASGHIELEEIVPPSIFTGQFINK